MKRWLISSIGSFLLTCLFIPATSFAYQAYIPHITGTGGFWRDYLQVNNDEDVKNSFTLTLYDNGLQVYQQDFSVDGLSQSIINLKTLVPNIESGCGVISYTSEGLYFRLSYEEKAGGGVAEFRLLNELNPTIGFYFSDFTSEVSWKALAISNPNPEAADVTLYALGNNGVLDTYNLNIAPFSKEVGLCTRWFPQIKLADIKEVIAVSGKGLCGVTISGNNENSFLLFTTADEAPGFNNDLLGTDIYHVYIPHITGTGGFWRDYLQVNNNEDDTNTFTLTLYDKGTQVYQQDFTVDGLSQSIIDLKTLAPNIESGCGVISYTSKGLYFRLSYEEKSGGGVAEFRLTDSLDKVIGFYFSEFSSEVTWKAIALSNLNSEAANIKLYAVGVEGVLDCVNFSITANAKEVGFYEKWFPDINFNEIKEIIAVSDRGLCGITITGNSDNSFLLFTSAAPLEEFGTTVVCNNTGNSENIIEKVFDSGGGAIEVNDPGHLLYGTKVELPSGSVSNGTKITIETYNDLPDLKDVRFVGHGVKINLDTLSENENLPLPVKITIPFNSNLLPANVSKKSIGIMHGNIGEKPTRIGYDAHSAPQ